MTSTPWGKAGPAGFDFGAHLGELAFIVVGGIHPPRATQYGIRPGARVSVVLLDGPSAGEEYLSVVLYGQRLVPRLRGSVGQVLLHRLIEGQGQGANRPNDLADPTSADEQIAAGWVAYYPGRLDQLLTESVDDFRVQEQAMAAQDTADSGPRPQPRNAGHFSQAGFASSNPQSWRQGNQGSQGSQGSQGWQQGNQGWQGNQGYVPTPPPGNHGPAVQQQEPASRAPWQRSVLGESADPGTPAPF